MQELLYHCEIKPKFIGRCIFFKVSQSGSALVLQELIYVQVTVLVTGWFAIETMKR